MVAVEAPSALQLAEIIGSGEVVLLSRISLGIREHPDGSSAWVGIRVWEAQVGNAVIRDLDGHITLMYVKKSALADLEKLAEGLEHRVTTLASSRVERQCTLKFNREFVDKDYAWGDMLVHSRTHAALHQMVHAACQRRGGSRQGLFLKRVPI